VLPLSDANASTDAFTQLLLRIAIQLGEHEHLADGFVLPGIKVVLCGEIRVTVDLSNLVW
jgi:hypothetical protein